MVRYKKKDLLNMVSTLKKVNQSMKNKEQSNQPMRIQMLTECQETAIEIGSFLESKGEAYAPIVKLLEDYCESIYQQSIHLNNDNLWEKLSKIIQRQLIQVMNSIKYDLPDEKKEVIFLPYKASMWDSLESVWMATSEEENCITYVIPIPYYDRNADRTLGKMHYEGNEYPDYVPITSWEEYSIEEHRPDIAYVHNPYDDGNRVTCIHPLFFAKELKKHIEMLVYIPYFMAVNDKVESHFCVTPVTIRADKIVVQSEPVRQTYIKELKKFEMENYCKGVLGNLDEKVLALGSPKYDKISTFYVNEQELPQEWRSIIYRSDGSRKKVILYNTSIQNILTYSEKMIEKIADSLKVFESYKDDIVLLWRPHPLIPATLQSMRPKLWNAYSAIVSQYRLAAWGIYDDTPDVDRAIALSDAYYGDGGSLLVLYEKTGKPILQQSILVNNYLNKEIPIWPCCFCVEDHTVWFVHGKMALLMKYDLQNQKIVKSVLIPGESIFQESLYFNIFQYEKKLCMIPCWARNIELYNTETGEFRSVKLKDIEQFKGKILFCKSFRKENAIYCIPKEYAYIVKINLENFSLEYIDLREKLNIAEINITDTTITNEFIFCIYNFNNQIIQYNLNTSEVKFLTIGTQGQQYKYIRYHDNKMYLFDQYNNRLEIRDVAYQLIKCIDNVPFKGFGFTVLDSDMILLDDAYSKKIICIDGQGNNIYTCTEKDVVKSTKVLEYEYYHGILEIWNGKHYYFDRNEYKLYEFLGKEKIATYFFSDSIEFELINEPVKESLQLPKAEENELLNLNVWLKSEPFNIKQNDTKENNGKKISQYIMREGKYASSIL